MSPRSGLLDIPLEDYRTEKKILEALAIGCLGFPRSGRDIRHGLESAQLDCRGDLLARFAVAGLEPLRPQFLQPVVRGPAEPSCFAVCAQRLIERRIEHVGAGPASSEDV